MGRVPLRTFNVLLSEWVRGLKPLSKGSNQQRAEFPAGGKTSRQIESNRAQDTSQRTGAMAQRFVAIGGPDRAIPSDVIRVGRAGVISFSFHRTPIGHGRITPNPTMPITAAMVVIAKTLPPDL